jgi:flagellar motor switch protein FliM
MAIDRVLSQDEIDNVFRSMRDTVAEDFSKRAQPYDFRRPDRIAKDQLRAIHMLHETFARSLASSLSAYLRAYVIVNLVSVEQLSFMEFSQCLPSPTVISALGMHPYEGSAVLELNPALVFPIVEILLGGTGRAGGSQVDREITEIEQSILDGVYRIILHDLKQAWSAVTSLEFTIEASETEPQMLQLLAPNEAVVAISMEVRLGEHVGMMNMGIPSIIIKMLRQKFDQQWSVRKTESTESEQARMIRLVRNADVQLDCRLEGATIPTQDLLALEVGDVLRLEYSVAKAVQGHFNGIRRFDGMIVDNGRRRCLRLDRFVDRSE